MVVFSRIYHAEKIKNFHQKMESVPQLFSAFSAILQKFRSIFVQ